MDDSQISNFFRHQTIFLTGGTGFLGKVLIEKLLRSCQDLDKIYVLVRPKKGKTREERFDALFDYPCFDKLKALRSDFKQQVRLVSGDCEAPGLGLSTENVDLLKREVSCVIHAAANVKFDVSLRLAAYSNVRALQVVLRLAKEMPRLRAFVHVSTAFSNCPQRHIKEEFYDPPMSAQQLLDLVDAVDDETLDAITPKVLGKWPNTYVYSKAVAESLIRTEGRDLPIAVVRPAIVTSTIREPMPGWIDNFYGIVGIVTAASLGVLRSLNAKLNNIAWLVPVDYVSNTVLAAAWDVDKQRNVQNSPKKSEEIPVYNYVGSKDHTITWKEFISYIEACAWDYPTDRLVWYYFFAVRENLLWHTICIFFLHTVPAYIADFVLICLGEKPLAVENYARIDKLLELTSYFSTNSWDFDEGNVRALWGKMGDTDKALFGFNIAEADFAQYTRDSVIGGRVYLLKDPLDTIPQGRKKMYLLRAAHYTVVTLVLYIFYKLMACLFSFLF